MGKKRTNKNHHHHENQHQEVAQQMQEEVAVIPAAADEEVITTPVKPQPEEIAPVQTEQQQNQEEEEQETHADEDRAEPTANTPVEEETAHELSPGGESPQGKKKEEAPVEEEEVVAAPDAQEEITTPATGEEQPAVAVEEKEETAATTQAMESPASTVRTEPLLPSSGASECATSQGGLTPQPETKAATMETRIVALANDVWEQPIVQFVAVVSQRILVAVLVLTIRFVAWAQTTQTYSKVIAIAKEKIINNNKYLKQIDLQAAAKFSLEYVDGKALTPLGLRDENKLQGKTFALVVEVAREMYSEAVSQAEKE